jgi:signal peptidase II
MTTRPPRRAWVGVTVILAIAGTILAVDQYVKFLTVTQLPFEQIVPVWGSFLQLYHTTNPGAAFSLGEGVTWVFTIALAVVAGVILWQMFRVRSRVWTVVLGAVLGGVLGNLTDRLLREPGFGVGHVVDMISMPWMLPAVFNVADTFIVTGMITVALLILFGVRLDGTKQELLEDSPGKAAGGS